MCLFPDRALLKFWRFTRGLTDNTSMVHGDRESTASAQDEIFGPIAPIIKVKDEEEALHVANQTEFGLSSAVFIRDRERGVRFALRVEALSRH
jgi:acyl-CoA reductase-like NAD-dependent aldehyde dehydrogenase